MRKIIEVRKEPKITMADDFVNIFSNIVDRDIAVKAARIICRYFGGVMEYIPKHIKTGRFIKTVQEILSESLGERTANLMVDKIMAALGRQQYYIPLERNAFRDVIAEEIYIRHYYENTSIREMCREYMISFTLTYKLWNLGRKIKLGKEKKK